MNPKQDSTARPGTTPWTAPPDRGPSSNGPTFENGATAEPIPDLRALEQSVRHLGSDWFGLAHVIIVCTRAILLSLRRIERRLDR